MFFEEITKKDAQIEAERIETLNNLRTIQLTHGEIEDIKSALQSVYHRTMDIVKENRKVLKEETAELIMKRATAFLDLQSLVDGDRDV